MSAGRIGVDQGVDAATIANVDLMVLEAGVQALQAALIPSRIPVRPEEVRAHVVIDAMDVPAECAEVVHDLRTNQSRRSRDEKCGRHDDQLWIKHNIALCTEY